MGGANLDRFSQPMTHERKETFQGGPIYYEVEEVVICKGCNKVLFEEEEKVQSEYWDDDYIHLDQDCIMNYYKHEKDPFAANKRVG